MICKECERLNTENKFIHAAIESPQPGKEQNLYFQLQSAKKELTNLKEAFARLREDRDMHSEMRQENHKNELRLLEELLALETEFRQYKELYK